MGLQNNAMSAFSTFLKVPVYLEPVYLEPGYLESINPCSSQGRINGMEMKMRDRREGMFIDVYMATITSSIVRGANGKINDLTPKVPSRLDNVNRATTLHDVKKCKKRHSYDVKKCKERHSYDVKKCKERHSYDVKKCKERHSCVPRTDQNTDEGRVFYPGRGHRKFTVIIQAGWTAGLACYRRGQVPPGIASRRGQITSASFGRPREAKSRAATLGDHGDVVVRLLASLLGEPGSIPGGLLPGFSHVGIVPDDAAVVGGFPRGPPVSPAPALRRCSILTSFLPRRLSRPRCKEPPKSLHTTSIIVSVSNKHGCLMRSRRLTEMSAMFPTYKNPVDSARESSPLSPSGRWVVLTTESPKPRNMLSMHGSSRKGHTTHLIPRNCDAASNNNTDNVGQHRELAGPGRHAICYPTQCDENSCDMGRLPLLPTSTEIADGSSAASLQSTVLQPLPIENRIYATGCHYLEPNTAAICSPEKAAHDNSSTPTGGTLSPALDSDTTNSSSEHPVSGVESDSERTRGGGRDRPGLPTATALGEGFFRDRSIRPVERTGRSGSRARTFTDRVTNMSRCSCYVRPPSSSPADHGVANLGDLSLIRLLYNEAALVLSEAEVTCSLYCSAHPIKPERFSGSGKNAQYGTDLTRPGNPGWASG
ncbi:hypothetical protein PR048_031501 [Dryococelus australis]|uniref:Uncharacterized protein n=1 Tax=Dryococelus australis TaxID=614101 RepID=A0ABQ9G5F8_9NEOP|nr:hypothetical protein PR048_031501 [Dryococelus australis]